MGRPVKLLLDTHALLWWWTDDPKLSPRARELIGESEARVLVSAASAWEIATKHRLGKLGLPPSLLQRYPALLAADRFETLPVTAEHALVAGSYPQPHRDPFDRMLAAQAEVESVPLLSCDEVLLQFGVEVIWD